MEVQYLKPSTDSKANSRGRWITSQARMILSAYRRSDFADPDGFVTQLGVILEGFSDAVIGAICNPRSGIQRCSKFPPSLAEVVDACDQESARLARLAKFSVLPASQPRQPSPPAGPGECANLLIMKNNPDYPAACRWAESANPRDFKYDEDGRGLWMSLHHYDSGALRSPWAR